MAKGRGAGKELEGILETLGDFTSKENWDRFFALRGSGDSFEWYAEWVDLRRPLLSQLPPPPPPSSSSSSAAAGSGGAGDEEAEVEILVPGCGSSRLSEHLYDAGLRRITNVDFSKVVVSDMLRRYVRSRPEMRWRVMDMTELQFSDESFDVVLDKGGLDALMEPEVGSKLGSKYLKEVKRVLKFGGKFICLTLAESHVLGLLFSEFRFGWETSIHAIPHKPSNKSKFQTFMFSVLKDKLGTINPIKQSFDQASVDCNAKQAQAIINEVENENTIRLQYSSGADIVYSLQDLQLGAIGNLEECIPGRRFQLILEEQGSSLYSYKAVLLDAQQKAGPFSYHCGVFIVPKTRAHEWLFTSEEGQWLVVESSKAARLVMVFLDSRHVVASMDIIQKDLSPLVKNLAAGNSEEEAPIPFMMANDGVKQRNIVRQVTSPITGSIIVEDVIYENADRDKGALSSFEDKMFRRLTFERSVGLVQSEALVIRDPQNITDGIDKKKNNSASIPRRKRSQKKNDGPKSNLKIDHRSLASSYHGGIISGFGLLSSALSIAVESGEKVKAVIIGLGAGLLPMFLRGCFPFLDIEVVELDPVVRDIARECFGFAEDEQLKVHIGDGIKFICDLSVAACGTDTKKNEKDNSSSNGSSNGGNKSNSLSNGGKSAGPKILIIDADSSDLSSGLTCPPADFIEESFLLSVRDFLSQGGLFIINLVSRSSTVREMVVSRLKEVFDHLFSLQLEEDVNEVLFASPTKTNVDVGFDLGRFPEAAAELRTLMKLPLPELEMGPNKLQRLK